MKTYPTLFYGVIVEQSDPVFSKGVSCLVSHIVHGLDGIWCLFQRAGMY